MTITTETFPAAFDVVVERVRDIPAPDPSAETACNWGNPEDCRDDNTLHAEWAGAALTKFARVTRMLDEAPETVLGDLMGDLMHLADALGLDFDALVERGRRHYGCEIEGRF